MINQLSLKQRLGLVCIPVGLQILYLPTSHWLSGGIAPRLFLDVYPIWPVWTVIYMLCWPIWMAAYTYIALKMDSRLFRVAVFSASLTIGVSMIIYVLFPTYVVRPVLVGEDFFTKFLGWVYAHDGTHDAMPSGHIYMTTLLVLFYSRWYPRYTWLWVGILALISFSTLYTGQHYILDVISGVVIAYVGYRFGCWAMGRLERRQEQDEVENDSLPSTT
jgi:membrane-associated phospholipid phosphatase